MVGHVFMRLVPIWAACQPCEASKQCSLKLCHDTHRGQAGYTQLLAIAAVLLPPTAAACTPEPGGFWLTSTTSSHTATTAFMALLCASGLLTPAWAPCDTVYLISLLPLTSLQGRGAHATQHLIVVRHVQMQKNQNKHRQQ